MSSFLADIRTAKAVELFTRGFMLGLSAYTKLKNNNK